MKRGEEMFLKDNLKKARKDKELTQKQLAERLSEINGKKVSNTAIANWESGLNSPDVDTLQNISTILDKEIDYFFTITENKKVNQSFTTHGKPDQYVLDLYNSLSPEAQQDTVSYMRALKLVNKPNKSKIQILGQTAAGQPIEYGDSYAQDIDDVENIPTGADYALTVNGDSMEPLIHNGQIIYIKSKPDVDDGTIAVVEIDDAVTCKKVYKWNDHIELQSLNTKYEPIIITGGNFRILGEVIFNNN